ncbi:13472_t:CDS:2 [Acaulospora colombiana]|uniref:13472_t:CDS:1 n=1 Tax=Acaulospora colombiana TaxID=27376 RepID=A0ACA9KUL7_9GLOM|nr:13472_t:CDS:2 [Acaulospora colombiana]
MAVASDGTEGGGVSGSQFFISTGENLDYLDGKYTVFGEVAEGFDTLEKINSAYCDETGRPYKDIRIKHTIILDDPFPDPDGLEVPDESPPPTAEMLATVRIGEDESIEPELPPEAMEKVQRQMEARAQALTLEMIGDIPFAEVKPPENVLFVCKLNPVTRDEDLELIFSRFGHISSCEIIRDKMTGDSLCYAFIEFDNKEDCETAYFKMNNVLIDDRRIKVDFSQSVSKLHKDWINSRIRKQGGGGYGGSESLEKRTRYRGGDDVPVDKYDLVFDHTDDYENEKRNHKRESKNSERERDDHGGMDGERDNKGPHEGIGIMNDMVQGMINMTGTIEIVARNTDDTGPDQDHIQGTEKSGALKNINQRIKKF